MGKWLKTFSPSAVVAWNIMERPDEMLQDWLCNSSSFTGLWEHRTTPQPGLNRVNDDVYSGWKIQQVFISSFPFPVCLALFLPSSSAWRQAQGKEARKQQETIDTKLSKQMCKSLQCCQLTPKFDDFIIITRFYLTWLELMQFNFDPLLMKIWLRNLQYILKPGYNWNFNR